MQVAHPTNDPNLVSYHRPELVSLLPGLELALDCWSLLNTESRGSAKAKYLTREPAEPNPAYAARLARSTYTPIYRDSIKAYAGLLSRFQLIEVPTSLDDWSHNVDLQGSSIQSFWNRADELAIRDGGCFIYVDMMQRTTDSTNFLDDQNDGRHPYLVLIERKDVINWSVDYKNGREFINHATFRQLKQKIVSTGFGVEIEPVYYHLRPNEAIEYRLAKGSDNEWKQSETARIATTMPIVPLVWYGASTSRFGQGDIPLNGLAELSIHHFQSRSDLSELLHKCAMPVPVRKGASSPDGRPVPLVLGPNTAVDLPNEGADFKFEEPSGRSLERHQADVEHIEMLMDRSGLNFLYGANIRTATEASLRASQVASQVAALVRNKVSSFGTMVRLWAAYMGELAQITKESGIMINDSLINRPLDPSGIAQLVNLRSAGILSTETVLLELQRGGVLDPDLLVREELKRVESEFAEEPVQESPPVGAAPVKKRAKAEQNSKTESSKESDKKAP